MNFYNNKTKKIIATVIIIVLVLTMTLPAILSVLN
jgi:hypothetical protein